MTAPTATPSCVSCGFSDRPGLDPRWRRPMIALIDVTLDDEAAEPDTEPVQEHVCGYCLHTEVQHADRHGHTLTLTVSRAPAVEPVTV